MGGFRGVGVSLVKAAIGGDRVAIERVIEAKMPMMRTMALRRLPRHLVDDVAQEAAINVFMKIGSLKNPELIDRWIFKIVKNKAAVHFKKWKRQIKTVSSISERNIFGAIEDCNPKLDPAYAICTRENEQIRSKHLRTAIEALGPELKDTTIRYYSSGKLTREIAEETNTSHSTIKRRLYYARKRMRATMEQLACRGS